MAIVSVAHLIERLRYSAAHEGKRLASRFLKDGEANEQPLTYVALEQRARAMAVALQEEVAPGDRVLLLLQPGHDFLVAFFGCLYARAIAVPVYPPAGDRPERTWPRTMAIFRSAGARLIVTSSDVECWLRETANPDVQRPRTLVAESVPQDLFDSWRGELPSCDDIAFLQYTSGSTGDPKGVVLSHGNLQANLSLMRERFRLTRDSHIVLWLPPYHDMGLIGGLLQAINIGCPVTWMAPEAFLQRPRRWLAALSRYRGTFSGGPNFAYEMCVRRVSPQEREGLDLSAWEIAANGSEPVLGATMKRFFAAFAPCGLRPGVLHPCYGLAEATLLISSTPWTGADSSSQGRAQSSGAPAAPDMVTIVDPETLQACPEGTPGEIWVKGPSVGLGYWGHSELTHATFAAHLQPSGEGPYLRTGDLGFLSRGELYITSRLKDLIILRGAHYFPQDIEATAGTGHALLRPGNAAAFTAASESEERLVVVHEIASTREDAPVAEIARGIRAAVLSAHDVYVDQVVLLRSGTLPKTSSGKIRRRACRDAFLAGTLAIVGSSDTARRAVRYVEPRSPLEERLAAQWADALGLSIERIGVEDDFFALGGHSLLAGQVIARLQRELGRPLSLAQLFAAPTIAQLAALIEEASPPAVALQATKTHGDRAPASPTQERLWLFEQLNPGTEVFSLAGAVRIEGDLDVHELERTLATLRSRHSSLRTTFQLQGTQLWQQIEPPREGLRIPITEAPAGADPDEVRRWLVAQACEPFDQEAGPLWRAALLRLSASEHVLSLVLHHAICDGWTIRLLLEEMGALFGSGACVLPPPSLQLPDFSSWQRAQLDSGAWDVHIAAWQSALQGAPAQLELPSDFPRPAQPSYRGAALRVPMPPGLIRAVERIARSEGATLFMGLLAGYCALLHRYTLQQDLVVGVPIANRGRPETERLAGLCANVLPLRCQLQGNAPFLDLLRHVREVCLTAGAHQEVPFEVLLDRLAVPRDPSHAPIFQVMFALQNLSLSVPTLGTLRVSRLPVETRATAYDLSLLFEEGTDGWEACWEYAIDLFEAGTVRRIAESYQCLLAGLIADPEQRLGDLPVLDARGRRWLLEPQRTQIEQSDGLPLCLHSLFAAQAARTPEAPALTLSGKSWSYAELDRRSDAVAALITRQGIALESRIALLLPPSFDFVAALLGAMKAGVAPLLCDLNTPLERLALICQRAGARLALTHADCVPSVPVGLTTLLVEEAQATDAWTAPRVHPDSLAYVAFTSGSTGEPKGVLITHRGIAHRMAWEQRSFPLRREDRVLQAGPLGIDTPIWELFRAFLSGAQVVVATEQERLEAARIVDLIRASEVSELCFVPSTLRLLLEAGLVACDSLRRVVCVGEPLTWEIADWLRRDSRVEVFNFFGQTEVSLDALYFRCEHTATGRVPIGRPLDGVVALVLDEALQLTPVGAVGELYLGGPVLARGYMARPDLTAECFVPNPYARAPGERLYRTGDLVRYRADGQLEFFGRCDDQIKLRGARIELAEVEARLAALPGVKEAAVVACTRPGTLDGPSHLAGYAVVEAGQALSPSTLRALLRQSLPDVMVPGVLRVVEQLPRKANGKLDRRALVEQEALAADPAGESTAARSPSEEILQNLFAQVLGTARPALDGDFFAMGGHSLLAMQLVHRIRELFQVELPPRSLFEKRTIAELAPIIDEARRHARGVRLPKPVAHPEEQEGRLSFAQQRLWFLEQLVPEMRAYNSVAALRLLGPLDTAALSATLTEIVRRHDVLRTTFASRGGEPLAAVQPSAPMTLPVLDLSHLHAEEAETRAGSEALSLGEQPFDLSTERPVRVYLLRLQPQSHVLVVCIHHIASDGWSVGVLRRELAALYPALCAGVPAKLPSLPIRYADFARWQRDALAGATRDRLLAYWQHQLADAPALVALPRDYVRPALERFAGQALEVQLPDSLTAGLEQLAKAHGCTLFMTLLAGFKVLLFRYSGHTDIIVGTDVAGRDTPEVENLIGFFVNQLVLRTDLAGAPSFTELLGRVRLVALEAYDHRQLPFDALVEHLQPERSLAYNPLFQVDFTLHPTEPASETAAAGLGIQPLPLTPRGARFDLEVNITREVQGLRLELRYNTDLFRPATIERLAQHYENLLSEVVADPSRRITEIPILHEEERARLLASAASPGGAGEERCTEHVVAAHAARAPDTVALRGIEGELTYRELEEHTARIAHKLAAVGVRTDDVVALLSPRDTTFWTAVLGIWKASAAYLPLDPRDPPLRHARMLGESRARWVVVTRSLRLGLEERLRHLPDAQRPQILDLEGALAPAPPAPQSQSDPRSLAYVLYTSGSTGLPKGAMVEHAGLLNHLRAKVEALNLGSQDIVAQTASQCFDISVWQLFAPLLVGGSADVMEDDLSRNPARLLREMGRVTVLEVVPSVLRGMIEEAERLGTARPPAGKLRWLIPTGEALLPELCRRWFALYPQVPLMNAYGPTECSDDVTHHVLTEPPEPNVEHVPIGRAVRGMRIHILDSQMALVPVAAVGELFVGGIGVGRGYLNDPVRTAEQFVPDAFGPPGARMYRTGDLARVLPDGSHVFIGRSDTQVKIRGHRIELGEIERTLSEHPAVAQAVLLVQDSGGERRLVAYATPAAEPVGEPSGGEAKSVLVSAWKQVFDDAYRQAGQGQAVQFRGWNSAYTGEPIPDEHMREWVDHTVARLRCLRPRRVLELGCGTGLLLEKLAPTCERYVGTDLSAHVIEELRRRAAREPALGHIELMCRSADDFTGIEPASFDTVILNSVVQYFPSGDYLMHVLEQAARALIPGGVIFLGDVRSLPLLRSLHLAIELQHADAARPVAELLQAVRRRVHEEKELVLAPAFFSAAASALPHGATANLLLKRGRLEQEMNRFRYDVILRTESADRPAASSPARTLTWSAQRGSPAEVAALLQRESPESVLIQGVVDGRIGREVRTAEWISAAGGTERVEEMRVAVEESLAEEPGVHPEAWWALEKVGGYSVAVGGTSLSHPGRYDVAFDRSGDATRWLLAPPTSRQTGLATNPLLGQHQSHLEPALRAWLRERLPEYMVPSTFVLLEEFPLTPNGKIDRHVLPAMAGRRPSLEEQYVAPRTPTEEALAAILASLLRLDRVGARDDFFELGGHSLIAMQVLSRIRDVFAIELSVRVLFEERTVRAIAERIEALRAQAPAATEDPAPILHAESAGPTTPLVPYQLPEWYLHELDPSTPFYNISLCNFLLIGALDLDAFVGAWQYVVDRHAAMRACFGAVDGQPVMRILPRWELSRDTIYLDRRETPDSQFMAEVQRLVTEYSSTAFDFQSPPFRLGLAEFSRDRFLLLFVVHHIIWDEASTMLMVKELSQAYNTLKQGATPTLPGLARDYLDYARWIHGALTDGTLEEQHRYWRELFRDVPQALNMPLDRPRPSVQTFVGDEVVGYLPADVLARIDVHARRSGTTLFIFLLSVLNTLLHRWTGQSDFVVGSPIENRRRREWQEVIGMFATALPLRCKLPGDLSFAELLRLMHETALAAYDRAEYPSVLLIQELAPEHDPGRPRLFSVMFGLQHDKRNLLSDNQLAGLGIEFLPSITTADSFAAPMDLTVIADFAQDQLLLRFNFKSELFERKTMERLLAQFISLAEQAVAAPQTRMSRFKILSAEDRALLAALTPPPVPLSERCLHHLFEAQVERTPNAIALRCGEDQLTYRELDRAAAWWAMYLSQQGLSPEDRVGVLVAPSTEAVVCVFAILKCGAAYVPLHLEDPPLRQKRILKEAGARWVLAPAALADALSLPADVQCVAVRIPEDAAQLPPFVPTRAPNPRNAAYVLYTSGTTGAPRGIIVEHAGLVNLVEATQRVYQLDERDTILLLTPLTFDASVLELFWPLTTGAHVVILPLDLSRDPARIKEEIVCHGISLLQVVPTMLTALLEGDVAPLRQLRWVICGGSYLPRGLRDRFVAKVHTHLANHYGPTEVTVDAARFDCQAEVRSDIVPIGHSIAHARIYVVDPSLNPVPPGVIGEICVASPGLARGYLNAPDLTASLFVPDPLSPVPGARMFRTGDIGRIANDGVLHYVGRRDHQVKVRGNRVELAEIEGRLCEHPGVRRCAVRPLANGSEGLIAHIELSPAASHVQHGSSMYHLFTLAQRRELARQVSALHAGAWPAFFSGDAVMRTYWPQLPNEFPAHQFLLVTAADEPLAAGNAVPIVWDGSMAGLPTGWDAGLASAFAEKGTRCPDTLLILTAVIAPHALSTGLSTTVLRCFKRLARAHGLARVVVAVRPNNKAQHPEVSFADWVGRCRPDGLPEDDWLRAHVRVGGRILGIAPRSQRVEGTVSEWEQWTGCEFSRSGEYVVPGAFDGVRIDLAKQQGVYEEPAVWVEHPLEIEAAEALVPIDRATLRAWLRESLPSYMVPDSYRFVQRLPLTATGKLDEHALAEAAKGQRGGVTAAVPPANPVQERMVAIWREVLGVSAVGTTDDFFELGGHSLLAVQLLAKLSSAFERPFGLRQLFRDPTIRGLEAALSAGS